MTRCFRVVDLRVSIFILFFPLKLYNLKETAFWKTLHIERFVLLVLHVNLTALVAPRFVDSCVLAGGLII